MINTSIAQVTQTQETKLHHAFNHASACMPHFQSLTQKNNLQLRYSNALNMMSQKLQNLHFQNLILITVTQKIYILFFSYPNHYIHQPITSFSCELLPKTSTARVILLQATHPCWSLLNSIYCTMPFRKFSESLKTINRKDTKNK